MGERKEKGGERRKREEGERMKGKKKRKGEK